MIVNGVLIRPALEACYPNVVSLFELLVDGHRVVVKSKGILADTSDKQVGTEVFITKPGTMPIEQFYVPHAYYAFVSLCKIIAREKGYVITETPKGVMFDPRKEVALQRTAA
jgi:hypothetical protein